MPSTWIGGPSPSDWSWNFITSWTPRTASPVLPLLTWTTSLDQVCGPTIPSAARPLLCWNALTADSVWGPKLPSTETASQAPAAWRGPQLVVRQWPDQRCEGCDARHEQLAG